MQRRYVYAGAGALLGAGASVALLALGLARRSTDAPTLSRGIRAMAVDPPHYFSLSASTALAVAIVGFALGRQADRLVELSATDSLTGLANARGLFDRFEVELARVRRYGHPLALLLVDLDGLKSVNDRYGHRAGDDAIRSLADVIRSELRSSDVGARWGGDEFAVLAPNTSKDAAVALAERIRARIPARDPRRRLSASLGVATIDPASGDKVVDSATLMRAADAALYEAKRSGKNRVVVAPVDIAHLQPADAAASRPTRWFEFPRRETSRPHK